MKLKPLLIIPPISLGVLWFLWMTQTDTTPSKAEAEATLAVQVLTITEDPLVIPATGFGRVTDTLPELAVGTVVEAGDLLVLIDLTDYELQVAIAGANLAAAQATLTELTQQEENSRRLPDVEQRILGLAEADFARNQTSSQNGTVTAASLDTAQRALLNQENAVINLTNTLALFPAQRDTAQTTVSVRLRRQT